MTSYMLTALDGPSIRKGGRERASKLGDPLTLLCGDTLRSNPAASVSWRQPDGGVVTEGGRYTVINDATGLKLILTGTVPSDNGLWTCNVTVTAANVTVPPHGMVAPSVQVGQEQSQINVLVVGKNVLKSSIKI